MADETPATDIEARLTAAAEAFREHELLGRHVAELRQRMDQMDAYLAPLRDQLTAEQRDVSRLEGLSLARVLASLEGARDDRLARERAEAEAVQYRVKEAENYLDALRREAENLQGRLDQLVGAPAAYAAVLDEKERLLRASGGQRASRLLQIADEYGRLTAEQREIGQAVQASQVAQEALGRLQASLGHPNRWKSYNRSHLALRQAGLFRAAALQSMLNHAARAAAYADQCLAVLYFELAEVGGIELTPPGVAPLTAGLATGFSEAWFAARATLMDRIGFAHQNVARWQWLVADTVNRLHLRASAAQTRMRELVDERGSLLTT